MQTQNITATADLMDKHLNAIVLPPIYRHFGGHKQFSGPCVLVECFEDNSKVKALLEGPGLCFTTDQKQVLIVNGQGSLQCALLGDLIATRAVANQWAGVIINGCVRDTAILETLALGVLALAATPRKSVRENQGKINPADFILHGNLIKPGQIVHVDLDGVVIL